MMPVCAHCGYRGRPNMLGCADGTFWHVCGDCGERLQRYGADDGDPCIENCRWTSIGQVLAWYIRAQERMLSTRSLQDVLIEQAQYGCRVSGGRGSIRADVLIELAFVEACLPSTFGLDGQEIAEAVVARAMLLLTCGGSRGDGLSMQDASEAVRRRWGEHWTSKRCERLLFRAQAETRGRLIARGFLPNRWAA